MTDREAVQKVVGVEVGESSLSSWSSSSSLLALDRSLHAPAARQLLLHTLVAGYTHRLTPPASRRLPLHTLVAGSTHRLTPPTADTLPTRSRLRLLHPLTAGQHIHLAPPKVPPSRSGSARTLHCGQAGDEQAIQYGDGVSKKKTPTAQTGF